MHKETDRSLHESGNYISVMYSIDTTNKESGTNLNNFYINVLLQWYVTEQYSNNILHHPLCDVNFQKVYHVVKGKRPRSTH